MMIMVTGQKLQLVATIMMTYKLVRPLLTASDTATAELIMSTGHSVSVPVIRESVIRKYLR